MLSQEDLLRYTRHLPVIGINGQEQLLNTKILCIGAGGLGSPILQYLAAAGIGGIGIIDDDQVELSNLQRQILFNEKDIGHSKAKTAAEKIKAINHNIHIEAFEQRLTANNIEQLFSQYDIVIDGTDNYKTRYLINDYAKLLNKPLVSASIFQFQGQLSVFNYEDGPCLRCLYPEPPPDELTPNCAVGGVLGVLAGLMGTLQAIEAIKIALNKGDVLSGMLLTVDTLTMTFKKYEVSVNQDCQLCQHEKLSEDLFTSKELGDATHILSPQELAEKINQPNEILLIDVRESYERDICDIGGTLIPLSEISTHPFNIHQETMIITYCKAGTRSLKAAKLLQKRGFKNTSTLAGGIMRWIDEIDPSLKRY